ncbi:MAG: InlB B-repeat-containing protein [Paludibacteraceae bacterium]|nr:InlB B-repeat-containing protein [Paludibacteraceae bacterium]
MKTTNTIKNFAKRFVMAITVMLMAGNVWGLTAVFTWGTNPGAYTEGSSDFSQGDVHFVGGNASGNTVTRAWSDGLRMYNGGTATFSVPNGYVITKIEGYSSFNYEDTDGEQSVEFTGLTKTTCKSNVTVTYSATGGGCSGDALEMSAVTATPGDEQVTLSWDAVTGATKYQVKWDGGSWTDVNTNSYTKTGLTNGTEYTYQVKAIGNGTTKCDSEPTTSASVKAGLCYTVNFSTGENNPEVAARTETDFEEGITLPNGPTPSASSDGWEFAGWAQAEVSNAAAAPELFMPGDEYAPEENITLYAVYRKLTGGTDIASFTASDITNLTEHSLYSRDWRETASGVEMYISAGQRYTGNPNAWNVTNGTSKFMLIDAHRKIASIAVTLTGADYKINSVDEDAGTAELTTSGTSQTVSCSGNVTQVFMYATSNKQIRATVVEVTYYKAKFHSNPAICAVNPTVGEIMNTVSAISSTGATFSTSAGVSAGTGCDLTAVGFVYGTATAPTLDNNVASIDNYTSGVLNKSITGLTPNTKYYVRAYATNSHGTTYSDEKEFTTLQRYNITYNSNGGSGSMDGSTKDHGVDFTLPANAGTMTKTGYHIANWRLGSASGTSYSLEDTYDGNADAEFYVGWEPNTFSVAFNKNGGQGDAMTNQAFTYDAAQNLSANTYTPAAGSHKYFAGWAISTAHATAGTVDYADKASVSNLTPTNNGTYTLYAVWKDHTYTNYRTSCCTELGTIGGAVEFTDPTTAVVTWNDMSNVAASDPYAVTYRKGSDDFGSTNVGEITTNNTTGKKECTITGLSCNTAYDFQIEVTAATGYCDKSEILEDQNSGKWNLDYDLTGVSLKEGDLEEGDGVLCGDLSVTFELLSEAYELPDDVVVEIGGVTKTKGTDYLWDENDGTLVIYKTEIDGKVEIKVEATLVGCTANPTVASAGLKAAGTFNLDQVDVETSGWSTGANTCAWTDYGFVWSTSANPALNADGTAPDGVNKVVVGTDGNATSWNGSLTGTFEAGVTYYFRAYGKNSKNEANYAYSAVNGTFTPRSVTYNSNGGSVIATVYVNNGGTVSAPTAPTRDGYTFSGWKLSGSAYDFTTAVNGNITLDAVWTAAEYTVTISKNYGSAGNVQVTATFDADMPSLSGKSISREGYSFAGIFANQDGTGTQYYNADKSSAHIWDQATNDATVYATWTPKPYTITLNNAGADEGHEGTASIAVTYDSNTNLTDAIELPEKEGHRFFGYYTLANGEGVQLIDAEGNVNASAGSGQNIYTNADKQWKKAGDVDLYAYWKECHTVTWYVNADETPEIVVHGEKVAAMPTPPTSADCDDAKKFIGWRAEKITGTSASAPDGIFTDIEHSPEVTDDVTFYAVFATETIGDIVLVKDIANLSNGDKVYIYSEFEASETTYGAVAKAYESGNNNVRAASGTVANEKLTPGTGACAYTFGKVKVSNEDYYTFNDGTYYLYAASTSDNHLKGETSLDNNDYGLFTIVINSTTGVASIRSKGNTSRGKMQFNPNSDTGDYTKAIFACYKSNANQTDVKLFKKNPDVYSDFVTTCASCDADATFTTALPAVSAEDCTSATVTATGGLATLGSEGCNISDYGFVLSTATNPELDGEGVTKLQVGTSNPTVGNDFSYDMTGLTKGTHYYVRAYAVNKHGVAYSSTKDFWTKNVSNIAVTTAPTKTKYIVGETFDATGMVVTATMADGSEVDVTEDVTYSTSAFNMAGTNLDFAINYSLCETNVQTAQKINIYSATVNEGSNPSKGDMSYNNAGTITISNLYQTTTEHTTVEFVKTNADIRDNGDGTFSIINPTGAVSITVNYVTASQVAVKFYANDIELEDLALNPFQSENFDMPAASAVANAMTAAGVSVSDDVHFVGWSASKFPYQTIEPTMVAETGKVTAATNYYAVFSNIQKVRIDEGVITGSYQSSETEVSAGEFTNGFVHKQVMASGAKLQFHKGSSDYGYVYNKAALAYINKIVIGYAAASTFRSDIDVYACSDKKTITGSILVAEERGNTDPYVYRFPDNISYFWVKGDNFYTYVVDYIDIYYAQGTAYYTTQFSTLTFNKADGTTDKTEKVATGKTRTLSADDAPAAVTGYTFMEKWSDGSNDYVAGDGLTVNADMTLNPYSSLTTGADVDINDLPATVTEIVVTDGKTLTVDAASTLDNLTVEAGGQVTLSSNKLTVVGTFTIETTMASGKSGQLNGATESNFEAQEDAYIDITLGDNGNPNKWHAFTVPFPVDAMNGIYDLDGNKLTNEVNYAIMDYHGDIRATGAYGWKKYRGVLVPGTFYLMTVDGARTTYRFKKTANGALVAGNTKALYKYASSTGNNDNGWNGVGNPTLVYGKVDQKVQVLNPVSYTYEAFNANETNFIVGTPFFIQATEDGTMTFGAAGGSTNYAPARTPANEIKDIKVTFGNEEYTDKLYISASEDALATYETGKDLVKMTMTSAPKVAQIFGKAYNAKLCMVNAPMVDDKASYALSLYAPADGTYRIETPTENENADLYLTKDGRAIWNLSMSACEVELTKGTTENYGLLLVRKAPGVATGMENVQSDNVQCTKVIIDNQVFILRGGQMYDVTGKAVK